MNFRMRRVLTVALVTSLGVVALPSVAQQPTQAGAQKAPSADAAFVRAASAAGTGEVEISKLAGEQASNDDVKNFAGTMVTDHTAAGDKLKGIAVAKNIPVSSEPMKAQQAALGELRALKGKAFDQRYVQVMKKDHTQAIALFKKEANSGQDPELKAFAAETLPTLEHHADMVTKLKP
jgi:putative membrane protein